MAAVTVTEIDAGPYPSMRLPVGGTGLCLFSAAFLGAQDAIHMARAGMELDLVDTDEARLAEMAPLYPLARTHARDAWDFAAAARDRGRVWDVVSADTWTGEMAARSMASLELWCAVASEMVTVTHTGGLQYAVPAGWAGRISRRSPLASWLVLTRG